MNFRHNREKTAFALRYEINLWRYHSFHFIALKWNEHFWDGYTCILVNNKQLKYLHLFFKGLGVNSAWIDSVLSEVGRGPGERRELKANAALHTQVSPMLSCLLAICLSQTSSPLPRFLIQCPVLMLPAAFHLSETPPDPQCFTPHHFYCLLPLSSRHLLFCLSFCF